MALQGKPVEVFCVPSGPDTGNSEYRQTNIAYGYLGVLLERRT